VNIELVKARIKDLDDGKWSIGMDEAGDYHHLATLTKLQDGYDVHNWKIRALLEYMERVSRQIEREDV
jgi:hypothetical protein